MRQLYEVADANHTTVGELTGTRRRYSTIEIPERIAQTFGLSEEERVIRIEHHDEGLSANELTYIRALWEIKEAESKNKK